MRPYRYRTGGWTLAGALLCLLTLAAAPATAQSAKDEKPPIAWGLLSGNTGCVIFAESRKTSTRFVGIFIVKWHGQLDVLETQNYDMQQKQWKETRDDLDALQKLAEQNKLKLVKIPAKHNAEQLEEARRMCTTPTGLKQSKNGDRATETQGKNME